MMTVSQELLRLYGRYDDWISGRVVFTLAEAAEFKRDFRKAIAQVGLLELGLDVERIDIMVQAHTPGSNVVLLNEAKLARIVARANEGDAS